ncbi:MAG: PadR family transcriptional regulator [Bacteroidota bacterium]
MDTTQLFRGTLQTVVLRLLAERGRMYGYELTQHVRDRTDGALTISEGALYPLLHKLVASGLLVVETERVNGRQRKYYRTTAAGQAAAAEQVRAFEAFVATMRAVLVPEPPPSPTTT